MTWQSKFCRKFQPIWFLFISRLLYFLENSNPSTPFILTSSSVYLELILLLTWFWIFLKRPCTAYLLLLQIYKEVFCKRSPLNLLNKILEKYLRKINRCIKNSRSPDPSRSIVFCLEKYPWRNYLKTFISWSAERDKLCENNYNLRK